MKEKTNFQWTKTETPNGYRAVARPGEQLGIRDWADWVKAVQALFGSPSSTQR